MGLRKEADSIEWSPNVVTPENTTVSSSASYASATTAVGLASQRTKNMYLGTTRHFHRLIPERASRPAEGEPLRVVTPATSSVRILVSDGSVRTDE